jgi:hypothetical protein
MSDSAFRFKNQGGYASPFCGSGVEFFPLGVPCDHSGFVLHEVGYMPGNSRWNYPDVLSPFWTFDSSGRSNPGIFIWLHDAAPPGQKHPSLNETHIKTCPTFHFGGEVHLIRRIVTMPPSTGKAGGHFSRAAKYTS